MLPKGRSRPRGRKFNGGRASERDSCRAIEPWREDHDWRARWAELKKEFERQKEST